MNILKFHVPARHHPGHQNNDGQNRNHRKESQVNQAEPGEKDRGKDQKNIKKVIIPENFLRYYTGYFDNCINLRGSH